MALSDEEADSAFRFLSNAMREAGLGWVINQVEEQLAVGKVTARKLEARQRREPTTLFAFADEPVRQLGPKGNAAMFAVSEEFTPLERLNVLLDGIDLAITVAGEVAAGAFANLAEFGIDSAVSFAPEADVSEEFSLSTESISEHTSQAHQLQMLLDELRREASSAH